MTTIPGTGVTLGNAELGLVLTFFAGTRFAAAASRTSPWTASRAGFGAGTKITSSRAGCVGAAV